MMYHIKPLGMIKTHGFHQDLNGYNLFIHMKRLREHSWHRYGIELNTSMT